MFLGKGSYGVVVKYKSRARKTFTQLRHLIQEYTALKYLEDCNYIVHCVGVNFDKKYIDMELYDMSLKAYLLEKHSDVHKHTIIYYILCGMSELHDLKLSHSDIKPGNILIKKDPLKAVLGDCGFVSIAKYAKQQRTAPAYRDLNIVNDDKHDIYSFGICFMEMLYNIKPEVYLNYKEIYKVIDNNIPSKHRKFIKSLICRDRNKRPSARDILLKLYHENPPHNDIKYPKYNYHRNEQLYSIMHNHSEKLLIRRCSAGYYALIYYFNQNNINEKEYPYYIAAMLIILASMFGNHSEKISVIMDHCFPKTKNMYLTKIIDIIADMTINTKVLKILLNYHL